MEQEELDYLQAAAAVYAWVSAADGKISSSEISSFVEFLEQSEFVNNITEEFFSEIYLTLLEAFHNDYDDGVARAEQRIEAFAGNNKRSQDLLKQARRAMLADNVLSDSEEAVLDQIEVLLGLTEDSIEVIG